MIAPAAPVEMVLEYQPMPEPQPAPVGTMAYPGDTYVIGVHDDLNQAWINEIGYPGARTIVNKSNLRQTNEMLVLREWVMKEDGTMGIRRNGHITYWPETLWFGWYEYFHSQMSARQKELFEGYNFGWRDGQEGELNVFKMVVCGGQLLKKIGRWKEYSLVVTQDTVAPPDESTPETHPHLWVKQGICGHSTAKDEFNHYISYYGKVNQAIGDFYVPVACDGGIAGILTSETREYPQLPFNTLIDGYPTRIERLCFRGSEVLGLTSDGAWYFLVQQVANNGNQSDFIIHSPDMPKVTPVSVVGWRKE